MATVTETKSADVVQTLTIQDVFENADCRDHPISIAASDLVGAKTIVAAGGCGCFALNIMGNTCNSYCDTESFGIGQLADGRFVVICEWSDTSGHGCQCSGVAYVRDTMAEILRELGLDQREALAAIAPRLLTA